MSRYGIILVSICIIDLLSTIIGIKLEILTEENPLLLRCYNLFGLKGLAIAKILLNAFSISILEILWNHKLLDRKKIKFYYILSIIIYIAVYVFTVLAILTINHIQ